MLQERSGGVRSIQCFEGRENRPSGWPAGRVSIVIGPDQEIVWTSWWSEVKPEAKHVLLVRSCGIRQLDLTICIFNPSFMATQARRHRPVACGPTVNLPANLASYIRSQEIMRLKITQDLIFTPIKILHFTLNDKQTLFLCKSTLLGLTKKWPPCVNVQNVSDSLNSQCLTFKNTELPIPDFNQQNALIN
jgi:hypothetical protein